MPLPPTYGFLETDADSDGPEVGRDVVVGAVQETVFGVDFHIGTNPVRDAGAEVLAPFVLAGVEKLSKEGKAAVEAVTPPKKKWVAG